MIEDYSNYHRDEDYGKFESMFRNIFLKRFKVLQKHLGGGLGLPRGGCVLDIGSSTGVFLDIFKEVQPSQGLSEVGWETWGVEPSKSGTLTERKGHKVVKAYFEKADLPKNYFDLVVMNHSLEHMDDPLAVLTKANSLLKKGGIVFVDVPNAGGLGVKILGKYWPYRLPEEHKWQFTKESLSRIMEDAGFKVIHYESRSGLFEFANPWQELWESLTTLKKRFFTNILTLPYSLFVTMMNMGDSMSLVGKKI